MKLTWTLLFITTVFFTLGANQGGCPGPQPESEYCEVDADCGDGSVCELEGPGCGPELICVSGCHEDSQCGPGQFCLQVDCFTCPCPGYCENTGTIVVGEGEACEEENVVCDEGLYCAWPPCGTPPVTTQCLPMGQCDWFGNCTNETNEWFHPQCEGQAVCENSQCGWNCN